MRGLNDDLCIQLEDLLRNDISLASALRVRPKVASAIIVPWQAHQLERSKHEAASPWSQAVVGRQPNCIHSAQSQQGANRLIKPRYTVWLRELMLLYKQVLTVCVCWWKLRSSDAFSRPWSARSQLRPSCKPLSSTWQLCAQITLDDLAPGSGYSAAVLKSVLSQPRLLGFLDSISQVLEYVEQHKGYVPLT